MARNAVKHHSTGNSEIFVLNLCDEAYWMIKRALANAKLIDLQIESEMDFVNWVVMNVNL